MAVSEVGKAVDHAVDRVDNAVPRELSASGLIFLTVV